MRRPSRAPPPASERARRRRSAKRRSARRAQSAAPPPTTSRAAPPPRRRSGAAPRHRPRARGPRRRLARMWRPRARPQRGAAPGRGAETRCDGARAARVLQQRPEEQGLSPSSRRRRAQRSLIAAALESVAAPCGVPLSTRVDLRVCTGRSRRAPVVRCVGGMIRMYSRESRGGGGQCVAPRQHAERSAGRARMPPTTGTTSQ
mmetsp:Transcript_42204/g.136962  ORF Transcript_42204/g.136962 Transcript_42204/m.136962 type:complete len:203 (+) Transcript_42204:1087-1695(+)